MQKKHPIYRVSLTWSTTGIRQGTIMLPNQCINHFGESQTKDCTGSMGNLFSSLGTVALQQWWLLEWQHAKELVSRRKINVVGCGGLQGVTRDVAPKRS